MLEYYSGILFLTTNRVGTLDEAFKSRIHMSLYYPPLDREQTIQIFEMNIDRIEEIDRKRHEIKKLASLERGKDEESGKAGEDRDDNERGRKNDGEDRSELSHHLVVNRDKVMDFARDHFDANKQGRWNGRQIRNAFQIASSLAFYDKRQTWIQRQRLDKSAEIGAAVLSDDQFLKVARATLRFEKYMTEARGADDKHLARIDRLRADDHVTEDTDAPPSNRDKQLQVRRPEDDDYRGSSRRFGGPSSPAPHTPQSGGRRGGDDYSRRRGGADDGRNSESQYDGGSRFGGDRDRDRDRDRDQDRDRDRDRNRDRDYNQNGGGSVRGSASLQDFRRRNGGDYDSGYSPRPNGGYDRDRDRDRPYDDRDDSYYDRNRDARDERAPASARSRTGGGAGSRDFSQSTRSRDRTPTRSERPAASYYDEVPGDGESNRAGFGGPSNRTAAGTVRDISPDHDRKLDDGYDIPTRYRRPSYQISPPTGTPRVSHRDY